MKLAISVEGLATRLASQRAARIQDEVVHEVLVALTERNQARDAEVPVPHHTMPLQASNDASARS